jgi:hypothetical protein
LDFAEGKIVRHCRHGERMSGQRCLIETRANVPNRWKYLRGCSLAHRQEHLLILSGQRLADKN